MLGVIRKMIFVVLLMSFEDDFGSKAIKSVKIFWH